MCDIGHSIKKPSTFVEGLLLLTFVLAIRTRLELATPSVTASQKNTYLKVANIGQR